MRNPIIAGVVLLALIGLPGPAAAQVAAPELNPSALLTTTGNPAVLQWNLPSRVTLGWHAGSNASFNALGVQTYAADTPGSFVQARFVGEYFAVGAEHLNMDIEPQGSPTIDHKQTQAALSGRFWGVVAAGVGQDATTQTQPGTTWRSTLKLAGTSVRLYERLYVGAASGAEQISVTGSPASSRSVTRYGIGWHMRGANNGLHLEASHERRNEYETAPGTFFDRGTLDTLNLEVIFANILVGLCSRTGNVVHPTSGNGYDDKRRSIELGWVPASGLAVVVFHEAWDREFLNGTTQDNTRDRVAVVWQF